MSDIVLSEVILYLLNKKAAASETSTSDLLNRYNPDQCPPDINMAIKHGKAKRVYKQAKTDEKKPKPKEICPCCGLPTEGEEIPLTANINELYHLGSGFALLFQFIKFSIGILLLVLVISGIYNLATAATSEDCYPPNSSNNVIEFCTYGAIGSLTIANKRNNIHSLTIQLYLNLVAVVAITVAFHALRYKIRKTVVEVDEETITPADFTVIVKGIDPNATDEDIKMWLRGFANEKHKLENPKIVRCYDIKSYIKLVRQRNKRLKEIDDEKNQGNLKKMQLLHMQILALDCIMGEFKSRVKSEGLKRASVLFITFMKANEAEYIVNEFQKSVWRKFVDRFKALTNRRAGTIGTGRIKVKRAPEPSDILWENLNHGTFQKLVTRCFTRLAAAMAICFGFTIIILVYWGQNKAIEYYGKNSVTVQFLSIVASLGILVVNTLLAVVIKIFTENEKYSTFTRYSNEMAEKLSAAQLINTAFTPLLAKLFLANNLDSVRTLNDILTAVNFYGKGGLLENMFYIFLTNAVFPPILSLIDPLRVVKKIRRKYAMKKSRSNNLKLRQIEAHKLFEENYLDVPHQYVLVIKTMLITSFYAPAMPIVLILSIIGLILLYWENKYTLLRRSALPNSMGDHITQNMIESLEWVAFVFGLGNLIFIFTLENTDGQRIFDIVPKYLIWVTIGTSLFHIFFPMKWINKLFFKVKGEEKGEENYEKERPFFHTDYDIENPITRKEAIKQFVRNLKLDANKQLEVSSRKRGKSRQQNGFLEKLKVENFIKIIDTNLPRGDTGNFDLEFLEEYANEKVERKATIFDQKRATTYEMKDLQLICEQFNGVESMEEKYLRISNILMRGGRTHKWKQFYQVQTANFSFRTRDNKGFYEVNIDRSYCDEPEEMEKSRGAKKRKRSRTDYKEPIFNQRHAPIRMSELNIISKDTRRYLKDSANVTRSENDEIDYNRTHCPINILEAPNFIFQGDTMEELPLPLNGSFVK